eukprot:superscaffoldBa00002004_g12820
MRIQFVCLLLVLLSATVLSRKGKINNRFNKFKVQHVIDHMTVDECDDVIQKRKISTKKLCKKTNTFIQANIDTVKTVCAGNGKPYKKQTLSLEQFDIVVCKLKKSAKSQGCHYNGEALNRKIIIKCEKGFPVHYGGDIRYFEN